MDASLLEGSPGSVIYVYMYEYMTFSGKINRLTFNYARTVGILFGSDDNTFDDIFEFSRRRRFTLGLTMMLLRDGRAIEFAHFFP